MITALTSQSAEAITKEFKEFAYIVSHDFSGPLRAMVEFSRLLAAEELPALSGDGKLYVSLIAQSGEKLQEMLSGILEYSRLNTMAKPFTKVDCTAVLNNCQIVTEDTVKKAGGKITIEADFIPSVMGDIDQLMQLFLALFDNAVRYRHPGRPLDVRVGVKPIGSDWHFTVRDNGIGIESQFADRIFKPFARLHTQETYPGIGMGLAFARKIVERHGGTIGMDKPAGIIGSSFTFTLPSN